MEYQTVYVISGQRVVKGELKQVRIKIDDNPYDDVTQDAPNLEFYYTEAEAQKALKVSLHEQMDEIAKRLEDL